MPNLGIADSCPVTCPTGPNAYAHVFGLLPPSQPKLIMLKSQSDGVRACPKTYLPKDLIPPLTSAGNSNF